MNMKTKIKREFDYLGLHHVETNKGLFTLEYKEIVPTKRGTEPKIEVTFRDDSGAIIGVVKWNSNSYLDVNTIINRIDKTMTF